MDRALELLSQAGDIIKQEKKHAKKGHLKYRQLSEENATLRKQLADSHRHLAEVALLPGPDQKRLKLAMEATDTSQVATDTHLATDISHKESLES